MKTYQKTHFVIQIMSNHYFLLTSKNRRMIWDKGEHQDVDISPCTRHDDSFTYGPWICALEVHHHFKLRLILYLALRKGVRQNYTTEATSSDDEGVLEARLDMVWRAVRAPVDIFKDSSPLLLAQALAREPEADLRYFTWASEGSDTLGAGGGVSENVEG